MIAQRLKLFFFSTIFLFAIVPHANSDNLQENHISVAVPAPTLSMLVSSVLPLSINSYEAVGGDLWVDSIRNLRFGKNTVLCSLRLRGKDVQYTLLLGETPVIIEVGDMDISFDLEGQFRFDNSVNRLYLKPIVVRNTKGTAENEPLESLLSLLSGVEYPIQIGSLKPFLFSSQSRTFQFDLSLRDVYSDKAGLTLTMRPKLAEASP